MGCVGESPKTKAEHLDAWPYDSIVGLAPVKRGLDPMEYSLTQFRSLVGVSIETHRHWKRILPPIRRRVGRSPSFTVGDLVGGAVVRQLTERAGVRVGALADLADTLFDLCSSPWASLEGGTLVLDLARRTCVLSKGRAVQPTSDLSLTCRLDPILSALREGLLTHPASGVQTALPFPPVGVAAEHPRRRA